MAFALLLTIALGVGANAAVYGFVRGLTTPDLPLPGIARLISLFTRQNDGALLPVSYADYLSTRAGVDTFQSLGAARESRALVAVGSRTSTLTTAAVTPALADLLKLSFAGGVVISEKIRRREFGDRLDVSGEVIRVDDTGTFVAGVAPGWLTGLYSGREVDVWLPLQESAVAEQDRRSLSFAVIGRLSEGVSLADAQNAVEADREGGGLAVTPYTGLSPDATAGLARLSILLPPAAGIVFLIACANVAAFLLARASARAHETAVRVALGASRARLGRQFLADSLLVSLAGGILGLLLAYWTAHVVPALLYDVHAEHLQFSPDLASIVGTALVCGAVLVVCGLVPLLEARHDRPASVLQREAGGPSGPMLRLRSALVLVQMAGCCMLLISTGLLFEGFRTVLRTAAGARLGHPILASVETRHGIERPDLALDYFGRAEEAALALPGISETAWVDRPPGGASTWMSVEIEPPGLPLRDVEMDVVSFTPRSLETVVLPPVTGRMFGGADRPRGCKVAIVNETAARDVFNGHAVGRSILDPTGGRVEIIGVVRMRRAKGATAPVRPAIFYYANQAELPTLEGRGHFRVPDRPAALAAGVLDTRSVSAGYFDAMGFGIAAGAAFDGPAEACRTGVINEEAAQLYFGGRAVGGAIIDSRGRRTRITGVIRPALLRAAQRRAHPSIYFPMAQDVVPRMTLILGAREAGDDLLRSVRQRLETIQGGALVAGGVVTLDEHLARTALAPERIAALLVSAVAVTALALAALGIYGAMAELARQHRREFALRIALGAQRWRVAAQVLAAGVRLAAAGILVGVLGAVFVARWLAQLAPEVGVSLSWVWLTGPLVLLAAVALASVAPARRARMADPLSLMREK